MYMMIRSLDSMIISEANENRPLVIVAELKRRNRKEQLDLQAPLSWNSIKRVKICNKNIQCHIIYIHTLHKIFPTQQKVTPKEQRIIYINNIEKATNFFYSMISSPFVTTGKPI